MLTVNIDIQDCLINDQTRIIRHIEFAQDSARKVYIKFSDEQVGSKAMRSSYLDRQNSWVPTEKCETEISIKKGSASPDYNKEGVNIASIKHTQFLLTLAWASTVHKVRVLSLGQGVIDFVLQKQKSFGPGQMYTALSRVKTSTIKRNAISGNTVTVLVHNVRSLRRHVDQIQAIKFYL